MTKFNVRVDQETCIGCAACTACCENFEMVGDKAKEKKQIIDESDLPKNKEAEEVCPVAAIKIEKSE
ncbi:ferredoxin [Candidatus Woesearchaeota archaeon]|nr:ferredoxin [Candidatus Woesearchaeota archaeon]